MFASTAVCAQGVSNIQKPDKSDAAVARGSAVMRIFGPAQPPHGFVRFCEATPAECSSDHGQESRFEATVERLKELDEVNRAVNKEIAPATDSKCTVSTSTGRCRAHAAIARTTLC